MKLSPYERRAPIKQCRLLALLATTCLLAPIASAHDQPLAGYTSLIVEKFTIEEGAATEHFPAWLAVKIQQEAIRRLRKKNVFLEVIDSSQEQEAEAGLSDSAGPNRRGILSGAVIMYKKGSRAKRHMVAFGYGATKIKMRFSVLTGSTSWVFCLPPRSPRMKP